MKKRWRSIGTKTQGLLEGDMSQQAGLVRNPSFENDLQMLAETLNKDEEVSAEEEMEILEDLTGKIETEEEIISEEES